jgi:CBS domain containing-hemolysin-like protein
MTDAIVVTSVVVFLILLNALYVAAEFSAVSARRSRVQELANEGNRLARLFLPVMQNPASIDRYVATCQIGITLASLVLGAYGQATIAPAITPWFANLGGLQPVVAESTSAAVVLVSLTALQVVVGELVPKSMALQNPTRIAIYTVLPMTWSTWAFRWFIRMLNGSGVLLLRLLGMGDTGHRHVHSPEELELLIAESRDGGLLEPDEQRRLHQALRLGLHTARQLMVPRTAIAAIDASWSGERVLSVTLTTPFSRLPVYEGSIDRVVGILHARDLVLDHVRHGQPDRFRSLIRPAATVPETMPADQLLRFFKEQRTYQAVVIDEYGGVAGLVTLEDVLTELLGEVGDEFRAAGQQFEKLPDGRYRIAGTTPVVDVTTMLGVQWDSSADTLSGHVMEALGRMPVPGDRLSVGGVLIEVERLHGRVPGTLLVTPPPEPPPEATDG